MSVDFRPRAQRPDSMPLAPPERRKRPFVLKAIIVLQVIQALGNLLLVTAMLVDSNAVQSVLVEGAPLPALVPFLLGMQAILGPSHLLAAIGLFRLRRWAWVLTMILVATSMTADIAGYFGGQPLYLSMIVNVVVVFYLNQSEVQDLFARRETSSRP